MKELINLIDKKLDEYFKITYPEDLKFAQWIFENN